MDKLERTPPQTVDQQIYQELKNMTQILVSISRSLERMCSLVQDGLRRTP
jgi:hypothetical protein